MRLEIWQEEDLSRTNGLVDYRISQLPLAETKDVKITNNKTVTFKRLYNEDLKKPYFKPTFHISHLHGAVRNFAWKNVLFLPVDHKERPAAAFALRYGLPLLHSAKDAATAVQFINFAEETISEEENIKEVNTDDACFIFCCMLMEIKEYLNTQDHNRLKTLFIAVRNKDPEILKAFNLILKETAKDLDWSINLKRN